MGVRTVIIYMTVITWHNGMQEVKFAGSKKQFGALKRHHGRIPKLELRELHISAADLVTIETVTSD